MVKKLPTDIQLDKDPNEERISALENKLAEQDKEIRSLWDELNFETKNRIELAYILRGVFGLFTGVNSELYRKWYDK